MKKLLLALALLLAPSAAFAQCNGVFPNNTVCGNVTGSGNLPRPTSPSSFTGTASGSNGQIQYNNSGTLGGFTPGGDLSFANPNFTVNTFGTAQSGKVPASGGGTANFLRADGSWAAPAGAIPTWNGQTGAITSYYPPQGRITLATATPVMSTTQSAKTTVFYTPYQGDKVPIYDGTNMVPTTFAEVSQLTTDTTKSPAAVANNSVYDIFCWVDSGTNRCTRGPAWTNNTTRGYTFTVVNGIALNTTAITNGPGASRGTWVGTICSNGTASIDYTFGASASGGTAARFCVWNNYNRVQISTTVTDSGTAYTYTSATTRQARGSTGNQIAYLLGSTEEGITFSYSARTTVVAVTNAATFFGVGFDTTTVFSVQYFVTQTAANVTIGGGGAIAGNWTPGIGLHTLAAIENGDGANANTFDAATLNGLFATIRM